MKKRLKEVVFITKGGIDYGWGHLFRSLSFGNYLSQEENCSVKMLISGHNCVKQILNNKKIKYFILGEKDALKEERAILNSLSYDALIADLLFISRERQKTYASRNSLSLFFNDLGYSYKLGDIIVCPQYLNKYPQGRPGMIILKGPKYFIINQNILNYARHRKKIRKIAKSLLIVAGGGIKKRIFERLLLLIDMLKFYNFEIKVILGYYRNFNIKDYPIYNTGEVVFLEKVKDIGKHINDADLVISSSGYLKYEISFLKTPLALFSINEHQKKLAQFFVQKGSIGMYLGDIRKDNLKEFSKKTVSLMRNYKMRKEFSKCGRTIVDGRGPERIYNAIRSRLR